MIWRMLNGVGTQLFKRQRWCSRPRRGRNLESMLYHVLENTCIVFKIDGGLAKHLSVALLCEKTVAHKRTSRMWSNNSPLAAARWIASSTMLFAIALLWITSKRQNKHTSRGGKLRDHLFVSLLPYTPVTDLSAKIA